MTLLIVGFVVISGTGHAQAYRDKIDDAFREMEDEFTLYFVHALTGEAIEGAKVTIGDLGTYQTDESGRVFFPPPEDDGKLPVLFSMRGFIRSEFTIEFMAGSLFFNRFSVTPALPPGTIRVVLDWNKRPADLDAHFYKEDGYHISYRHMKTAADGTARLDRDDRNGFGPETITVERLDDDATYEYKIHNYSDRHSAASKSLSRSAARIHL